MILISKLIAKEINTLKKNHIKIKKKMNILFVPEGLLEENYKMLHFCIESAKKNKNLEFNFRFHPLIDPEKFLIDFRFKNLLKEISNLQISKNELDYDIKLNDFVVFRGSSIAFDACLNDKIPLYLDIDEFNCNPLFKVLPKCLHINQISDFKNLTDVSSLKYNKEELKSYCLNYFQKLKPEVILTLINE